MHFAGRLPGDGVFVERPEDDAALSFQNVIRHTRFF
jgi:hypothetical protein